MSLIMILAEYIVFHTLVEKFFYNEKYQPSEDKLIPLYSSLNEWRPLTYDRLYVIKQLVDDNNYDDLFK